MALMVVPVVNSITVAVFFRARAPMPGRPSRSLGFRFSSSPAVANARLMDCSWSLATTRISFGASWVSPHQSASAPASVVLPPFFGSDHTASSIQSFPVSSKTNIALSTRRW
jgi:hypothetical protein